MINIATRTLTSDAKEFVDEVVKSYLNDEIIKDQDKYGKWLYRCGERVSPEFNPNTDLIPYMFTLDELNIYGIYSLDPKHELLVSFDKIITFIRSVMFKENPPVFRDVELHEKLNIPLQQIRLYFTLFSEPFMKYGEGAIGAINCFGKSAIEIKHEETIRNYRRYESIETLIEEVYKNEERLFYLKFKGKEVRYKKCSECSKEFSYTNDKKVTCSGKCRIKRSRNKKILPDKYLQ